MHDRKDAGRASNVFGPVAMQVARRLGVGTRCGRVAVLLACAATFVAMPARAQIVSASPDVGAAVAGTASTAIASVTANDSVNGGPVVLGDSGNASLTTIGSWPAGLVLDPATGAVSTTAALPVGVYVPQYQLCDRASPPDCGATTVTVVVSASIVATPETGNAVAGSTTVVIANVAANDTIDGSPATLGAGGNATVAVLDPWPAGITLDPSSGAVAVAPTVAVGSYSVGYQLCDLSTPANCATATDTVIVAPWILAVPESGSAVAGTASVPIANVAANDTVNGAPATLGGGGNAAVAAVGTWPVGIGLDPASGAVAVAASVPAGTYALTYQLCDLNAPPDCATTTDTIVVTALPVVAISDSGSGDAGVVSRPIGNVVANDTVNGAPATLGSGGNATVAPSGSWPPGLVLNAATGWISTAAGVPAGVYTVQYTLCDLNTPANCANATATVTLIAPSVVAASDSGVADSGTGSKPIATVVGNDSVNGAPATLGTSGNSTVVQVGTWPAGIALNTTTGAVTTTPSVAAGTYSLTYRLCDKNLTPVCATAVASVSVIVPSIVPVGEAGNAVVGIASTPIANVAANDTVNGVAVTLATPGNASVAAAGTWPGGITLNTATGAISVTAAVALGSYNLTYRLCDRNSPPVCATTTDVVRVLAPSIVASRDVGSGDATVASRPIANVASNDTINGATATLGTSGNATVARLGTWPTGIALNTTTGAVTTTSTVPVGTYNVQYQLCDKSSPPNCAQATDTVVVINASIIANAESGSAVVGTASTAIASVVANDTVNGVPALLGSSGNATVATVGTWPTGIALNAATGAVTTTAAVPVGSYGVQYHLCDRNVPAVCSTVTDTVNVIGVTVLAAPDSGTAVPGIASKPIVNVAANDTIGGLAASLGPSGNATVVAVGSWPTGLSLDGTTGAVSTTTALPAGTYSVQYQLCDRNVPPDCATATDTVVVATGFSEVQVTNGTLGDIEFDWGRDGVNCPTCNYGQGNARFNWTDKNGNLWVGHVDPTTGLFTPATGMSELVDSSTYYYATFGNGPEWAFSTQGGQVVSQLVSTRYPPGMPAVPSNAGAAFATPGPGGWSTSFLPGADSASGDGSTINTVNPIGSQCLRDTSPVVLFNDLSTPQGVYWEPMSTATGTAPVPTPFGAYSVDISGGKPGVRWVPCTRQIVFTGLAAPDGSGNVYQQVFWYDTATGNIQQLTSDPHWHTEAFAFLAPEFGDTYVLYTIADGTEIDIYGQTGVGANGIPTFQIINRITSPDPSAPFMVGTEPFIHCAPACQSYIFTKMQAVASTPTNVSTTANGVAVTNINPAQPVFKILAPLLATPTIQRNDLEYYISANGPYLYYTRAVISSPTTQFQFQGRFFIDMQLGAPSGPCVGSSAESGLAPGC